MGPVFSFCLVPLHLICQGSYYIIPYEEAVINKNCRFLSNWFKVSLLLQLTLLGVCLEQARYLLRAHAQPPEKALRNRSIHLRSGHDFAFPAQVNPLVSPEFRSFFALLIGILFAYKYFNYFTQHLVG